MSLNLESSADTEDSGFPREPSPKQQDEFISIHFPSPGCFQKLVEYIKVSTKEANLVFMESGMTMTHADSTQKLINELIVDEFDVLDYTFRSEFEERVIGLDFANFHRAVKNLSKSAPIMMQIVGDSDVVSLGMVDRYQFHQSSSCQIKEIEFFRYNIVFGRPGDKPVYKMKTFDFKSMCAGISSIKNAPVIVEVYERGIVFSAGSESDIVQQKHPFGEVPRRLTNPGNEKGFYVKSSKFLGVVRIHLELFKKLAKISAIPPRESIVRFFYDPGIGLKIVTDVGSFALMNTYIRDWDTSDL